ncbi:hypothetical protein [Desertimonas flava]|uniref:hypothetical protein n=1 Tax=Desertimonas flava TaxID=2064846 RepID=UPI0013C48269|nr:hypothetical protein [Desertimonas flava]
MATDTANGGDLHETGRDDAKRTERRHYVRFGAMTATSTVMMFALMFSSDNVREDC